jgi:hypothetical protein
MGRRYVCGSVTVSTVSSVGLRSARAQIQELKGVNAPELRTQVDLLLYQAFPRGLISSLCEL